MGGVIGGIIALFTPSLRRYMLGPKLEIMFDPEKEGFVVKTPFKINEEVTDAYYIRVMARNVKQILAKECRTFLINIEKQNENGIFEPTLYCDSIQLQWSARSSKFDHIDLPNGISQFIDVLQARKNYHCFKPLIEFTPFRYQELFQQHGIFRFTIQIAGNDIVPKFIKIVFHWKGKWDDFEVYLN